ncbi:MAG: hypothetical protein B6I20_14220 [Bacteroidetes bacterium 4572_117]|nr:MAG: hypothetical protein B6I20_14220 [Bacteroidetes bacterium 4572_117]
MNFKNIDNWSFGHKLVRAYVGFAHNKIFYKKICVTGIENIPKDKPVFFAPNHQNALMDALVIIFTTEKQPVFLARGDIFNKPLFAKILIFFKVLPAFRIRDGKDQLKRNDQTFDAAVNVLKNKNVMTLFPEAQHIDKRRLRTLKKGVQRIVFQTENSEGFKLGTQIVPVGINYSNYWNFRSTVLVNYGKPIRVDKYKELFHENQQKAMLALRDEMTLGLLPQMIHIKTEEHYELYEQLREIYHSKMLKSLNLPANQTNKFIADKKLIDKLNHELEHKPETLKGLSPVVKKYVSAIKQLNIKDWVVRKDATWPQLAIKSVILLILLPFFIYGVANNIIPYLLPSIVTKKLKDRQFTTSITFVFGIVFFPIFYLLQSVLFLSFIEPNWLSLIYFISLPISGLLAFNIHRSFVKIRAQWKFLLNKKNKKFIGLSNLRKEIISKVDTII